MKKLIKQGKYRFWKLPLFTDHRGALCAVEFSPLPFRPKRMYFIYDVKELRGGHAHEKEKEVFICIKGSFRATIHDGTRRRNFFMNKPGQALYTDALVWHQFDLFSNDAVMLALSSTPYKGTKRYIIDFEKFLILCKKRTKKS